MKKIFKTKVIENFIKKNNWSMSKFCKECKIGVDVYKKIMKQQITFRASAIFKIARVIKIDAYKLFY